MHERRLVRFRYDGFERIGEPHDLGLQKGLRRLLVYQLAGGSRSGRLPDWRLVTLDKVTDFALMDTTFAGPRDEDTRQHYNWDRMEASVSRPVLRLVSSAE